MIRKLTEIRQAREAAREVGPAKTLVEWKQRHAHCAKNPWLDVQMSNYNVWRCICGEKFSDPVKR